MPRAILMLVLLCLAWNPIIASSDEPAVVYAISELQPWKIWNGDEVEGIDIIIMKRLAAIMKLQLHLVQAPLARCLSMLEQGTADLISSISVDAEREKYLCFLPTAYKGHSRKVFYIRTGSTVRIDSYADLKNYLIGAKIGANYFEPFNSDPDIRMDRVADDASNFRKLAAGRIDCLIANEPTGDWLIMNLGLKGQICKASWSVSLPETGRIAISRKSALFPRAAEMETLLKKMVDSGEINTIIQDYFRTMR